MLSSTCQHYLRAVHLSRCHSIPVSHQHAICCFHPILHNNRRLTVILSLPAPSNQPSDHRKDRYCDQRQKHQSYQHFNNRQPLLHWASTNPVLLTSTSAFSPLG